MEASKETTEVTKRQPFDFKIKELKRQLKAGGIPKKERNRIVSMYKDKVYTRVAEVREKMEKEFKEKQLDASDK